MAGLSGLADEGLLKFSAKFLLRGGYNIVERLAEKLGPDVFKKVITNLSSEGLEKIFERFSEQYGDKAVEEAIVSAARTLPKGALQISQKAFIESIEKEVENIGRQGATAAAVQAAKAAQAGGAAAGNAEAAAQSTVRGAAATVAKDVYAGGKRVLQIGTGRVVGPAVGLTIVGTVGVPAAMHNIRAELAVPLTPAEQKVADNATGDAKDKNGNSLGQEAGGKFNAILREVGGDPRKDGERAAQDLFNAGVDIKNADPEVLKEKIRGWLKNDRLPWYEKLFQSIAQVFKDPKSFGAGSLIGAVVLGLAGGWLGGGFSAVGVGLGIVGALVGMVVPALMGNPSVAPNTTPPKVAQNGSAPAVSMVAQHMDIEVPKVPTQPVQKPQTPGLPA